MQMQVRANVLISLAPTPAGDTLLVAAAAALVSSFTSIFFRVLYFLLVHWCKFHQKKRDFTITDISTP